MHGSNQKGWTATGIMDALFLCMGQQPFMKRSRRWRQNYELLAPSGGVLTEQAWGMFTGQCRCGQAHISTACAIPPVQIQREGSCLLPTQQVS